MSAERLRARVHGERTRVIEQIARMRALIHGLEISVNSDFPALENAQAVADAGIRLANTTARLDAYVHATHDLEKP